MIGPLIFIMLMVFLVLAAIRERKWAEREENRRQALAAIAAFNAAFPAFPAFTKALSNLIPAFEDLARAFEDVARVIQAESYFWAARNVTAVTSPAIDRVTLPHDQH